LLQFIEDISEYRVLLTTAARSQRAIVSKEHVAIAGRSVYTNYAHP